MNNVLTVLLIEDDPAVCERYAASANSLANLTLVGTTNNSTTALQYIKDCLPQAVILDLELHNGSGSGFDVLNGLESLHLSYAPYILVSTNNTSSFTHEFARKLGADYIYSKHQGDYSEQRILEFLLLMKGAIQDKCKATPQYAYTTETPQQREQRIMKRITSELNWVGISPKLVGRTYLTEAIWFVINNPRTNFFAHLSDKYDKSITSIERAMQNAIDKAWRTADIDELLLHYDAKISSEKGVPTIGEFVHYYSSKIYEEYK